MEENNEPQEIQQPNKVKQFINECWRVLKVTKKPTKEEYKTIVKAAGLGILLIGLIGFIIQMIRQLLIGGSI
jgi:protein transport protein SEC61 subunit gamma-like protein